MSPDGIVDATDQGPANEGVGDKQSVLDAPSSDNATLTSKVPVAASGQTDE
jgi:hypothetical protein